jgi:hypothetical protein
MCRVRECVWECVCVRVRAACLPAWLRVQTHPDYLVYGGQTLMIGHLYSVRQAG